MHTLQARWLIAACSKTHARNPAGSARTGHNRAYTCRGIYMLSGRKRATRASTALTGHAARHRFFPAKIIRRSGEPHKRASYRYFHNRVDCFLRPLQRGGQAERERYRSYMGGGIRFSSRLWSTTACQSYAKKIPKMGGGQQARNDGTRATQTV